jgi:diacylglycerol kinase (ATP)
MIIDLIVNPASGPRLRGLPRDQRLAYAVRQLEAAGATGIRATATRSAADAAEAARRAVAENTGLVVAWGGDGTVNDVARELVGTSVPLAIVPGGSGNGLARGLGIPLRLPAALHVALHGSLRDIDTGLAGSRPFFNIAGIGLDGSIAHRFNLAGSRRGLRKYLEACWLELRAFQPTAYAITADGEPWFAGDAHLVAIANGPQYGHNACIAPDAAFDDGWFDVVVVPDATPWRVLRHGWRLFGQSVCAVPGVRVRRARRVDVRVREPRLMHLDGEVHPVDAGESFAIRPQSLRVRVP